MKNYQALFRKVSTWLRPSSNSEKEEEEAGDREALLFVHIFCHRTIPYHFEESDGWMAQNFFYGGFLSILPRYHIKLMLMYNVRMGD